MKTILEEAHEIINGPRRDSYGDAKVSFGRVANVWSQVLGREITPHQVALCMIGLKLCRESNRHTRDNLIDICGYAQLADKIVESAPQGSD